METRIFFDFFYSHRIYRHTHRQFFLNCTNPRMSFTCNFSTKIQPPNTCLRWILLAVVRNAHWISFMICCLRKVSFPPEILKQNVNYRYQQNRWAETSPHFGVMVRREFVTSSRIIKSIHWYFGLFSDLIGPIICTVIVVISTIYGWQKPIPIDNSWMIYLY